MEMKQLVAQRLYEQKQEDEAEARRAREQHWQQEQERHEKELQLIREGDPETIRRGREWLRQLSPNPDSNV
jgi:hypothetical protein